MCSRELNYLKPSALRRVLVLVLSCPGAAALADSYLPAEIGGWIYGSRTQLKPTAIEACQAMTPQGMTLTSMVPTGSDASWSGTSYTCNYYWPGGKPSHFTLPAFLTCNYPYIPRWPGVCVANTSPLPPPPSCDPGDQGLTVGNPVMVSSGVKIHREVDPIGGPSFAISRTYRSVRYPVSQPTAGRAWSFSFERQFHVMSTTGQVPDRIRIISGDGSVTQFYRTSSGSYSVSSNSGDSLTPLTLLYDDWVLKQGGRIDRFKKIGASYLLVSSHSKDGAGMFFTYDATTKKLSSIADSFGRVLKVEWEHPEGIVSIAGAGAKVLYSYEHEHWTADKTMPATLRLAGVAIQDDQSGTVGTSSYHYENDESGAQFHLLTGITDGNGDRFATYAYDWAGRVVASEHAGGADSRSYQYADTGTTVTEPNGAQRIFTKSDERLTAVSQPGGAGCGPAASALSYNSRDLVGSRTDFNNRKTCFVYDDRRPLEKLRVEGLLAGESCSTAASTPKAGQRLISTQWHPDWNVEARIAEPLKITTLVYNGRPDLDGKILDCAGGGKLPDGKPLAVVCKRIEQGTSDATGARGFAATAVGMPRVASYTYNPRGQILSATTFGRTLSGGDTTRYAYYEDTSGFHTLGDLWKETNPKGHVREYFEYTAAGLPTRIKEPNGQITLLTHNARHQLTRRVTAAGTSAEEISERTYDAAGQLIKVTGPDLATVQYSYDPAHRLTDITDSSGNSIRYTLDNSGNRIGEEVRDSAGGIARKLTRSYDALNRLQSVTKGGAQ